MIENENPFNFKTDEYTEEEKHRIFLEGMSDGNEEMKGYEKSSSILEKARTNDNEPVFVLRAKDRLALGALKHYLQQAEKSGLEEEPIYIRLLENLVDFLKWQKDHPTYMKLPD